MFLKKRLLALLTIASFLFAGMIPTVSAAPQELVSESGYTYHIADDGKSVVLTGYTGTETELILPSEIDGKPVFSVSGFQADNAVDIQKIVIPEPVRIIGPGYLRRDSFRGFTALTELVLPDSLFAVYRSFWDCTAIRTVRLPHSLHILAYSFNGCPDIRFEAYPLTYNRLVSSRFDAETAMSAYMDIIPYPYTTGDLNADNQINTTDARLLLQAAVDKLSLSEEAAAVSDVNGDGKVDTTDARLALQYAVGKTDDLAAELLPDIPLIDPDDSSARVYQIVTPDDTQDFLEQPIASPHEFLQTLASLMATKSCTGFDQIKTMAQYTVHIETATATMSLGFFTKSGTRLEIRYEGHCFAYSDIDDLLSYLI